MARETVELVCIGLREHSSGYRKAFIELDAEGTVEAGDSFITFQTAKFMRGALNGYVYQFSRERLDDDTSSWWEGAFDRQYPDEQARLVWQAQSKAIESKKALEAKLRKLAKDDELLAGLKPIRDAYKKDRDRARRRALLALAMQYIVGDMD